MFSIFSQTSRLILHILMLSVVLMVGVAASEKELIGKATKLLNDGEPASAYQILDEFEEEYAGWWEFDYIYGVAALESGNANLAIFSLHRVVAMKPDFVGAHIDLGRAYFDVNEYSNAKNEFNYVLASKPNITARKVSSHYLSRIEDKLNPIDNPFGFYALVMAGYDTNSNSATDAKSYLGYDLDKNSRKAPSPYVLFKFGNQMRFRVKRNQFVNLSASIAQRKNNNADHIDSLTTSFNGQWSKESQKNTESYGFYISKNNVSEAIKPDIVQSGDDLEAEWTDLVSVISGLSYNLNHRFSKQRKIGLFSSLVNLRYRNEMSSLNSIQLVGGSSATFSSQKNVISLANLSGFVGKSYAIYANGNSKNLAGGRIGIYFNPIPTILVQPGVSVGVAYTAYDNEVFGLKRRDGVVDTSFSLQRRFAKKWDLNLSTMYVKSNSTVNLYDFDRINASLSIKRNF